MGIPPMPLPLAFEFLTLCSPSPPPAPYYFRQGYRYELYCAAREACTHYCVVHAAPPLSRARAWNDARVRGALLPVKGGAALP